MSLLIQYRAAQVAEDLAQLRRALVLRAMLATGSTQRQIASALGVSQPAIRQQLKTASQRRPDPQTLIAAGGAILKSVAEQYGFTDLAVFGSVARGEARPDSDIDLLARPPIGTTITDFLALKRLFETILDHPVDLVSYGGLNPSRDDDILREAVPL